MALPHKELNPIEPSLIDLVDCQATPDEPDCAVGVRGSLLLIMCPPLSQSSTDLDNPTKEERGGAIASPNSRTRAIASGANDFRLFCADQ